MEMEGDAQRAVLGSGGDSIFGGNARRGLTTVRVEWARRWGDLPMRRRFVRVVLRWRGSGMVVVLEVLGSKYGVEVPSRSGLGVGR